MGLLLTYMPSSPGTTRNSPATSSSGVEDYCWCLIISCSKEPLSNFCSWNMMFRVIPVAPYTGNATCQWFSHVIILGGIGWILGVAVPALMWANHMDESLAQRLLMWKEPQELVQRNRSLVANCCVEAGSKGAPDDSSVGSELGKETNKQEQGKRPRKNLWALSQPSPTILNQDTVVLQPAKENSCMNRRDSLVQKTLFMPWISSVSGDRPWKYCWKSYIISANLGYDPFKNIRKALQIPVYYETTTGYSQEPQKHGQESNFKPPRVAPQWEAWQINLTNNLPSCLWWNNCYNHCKLL